MTICMFFVYNMFSCLWVACFLHRQIFIDTITIYVLRNIRQHSCLVECRFHRLRLFHYILERMNCGEQFNVMHNCIERQSITIPSAYYNRRQGI